MLDSLLDTVRTYGTDWRVWGVILATLVIVAAGVYAYFTYIAPTLNPSFVPNNEFVAVGEGDSGDGPAKDAELFFFFTEWCPHCQKAKPVWASLKEEIDGKLINRYRVIFREVDCDKDEKMANEFGVEGYPTIKLVKDGQVIEYDAKPDKDILVQFLQTSLQ
jgi:thiol-disulfide isomerase/thioredoxin